MQFIDPSKPVHDIALAHIVSCMMRCTGYLKQMHPSRSQVMACREAVIRMSLTCSKPPGEHLER